MLPTACKERLAALLGPRGYLDRPEDLTLYEYDGGVDKHRPDLVVFPRTTEEVAAIVTHRRTNSRCRSWAAAQAPDFRAARFRARAAS